MNTFNKILEVVQDSSWMFSGQTVERNKHDVPYVCIHFVRAVDNAYDGYDLDDMTLALIGGEWVDKAKEWKRVFEYKEPTPHKL